MGERLVPIRVNVNREDVQAAVAPERLLLEFLREDLGLTGPKEGCQTGVCGICTVLVDGEPVKPCLMLAVQADGTQVLTVEGLAQDGRLTPLQQAMVDHGGIQCGICTPGMIMTATALVSQIPTPSEEEVREYMAGTICRCTGYQKIVAAILAVAGPKP